MIYGKIKMINVENKMPEIKSKITYRTDNFYTKEQVHALFQSVDWISANYPERVIKALANCETVITAWDGTRLVGLINAIDDGELTAYSHYLCILPDYQGQGIGRELLRQLKQKYKQYLYLILIAENEPLIKYYEANGFKQIGESFIMEIRNP